MSTDDKKTAEPEVKSIALLAEIINFMDELTVESDEDSCMGMAFFEGRISEDWFYSLKNRIEKQMKANDTYQSEENKRRN